MVDEPIEPRSALRAAAIPSSKTTPIAEEANLLADEGHDARAFSLSVLGAEELSKAWAALVVGLFPDDPAIGPELRAILRGHHKVKIDASLFLERDVPKLAGLEPDAMARELDGVLSEELYAKKNAGMYVDLVDGRVEGPGRIGPEDVALGKRLRRMVVAWGIGLEGIMRTDLEALEEQRSG